MELLIPSVYHFYSHGMRTPYYFTGSIVITILHKIGGLLYETTFLT